MSKEKKQIVKEVEQQLITIFNLPGNQADPKRLKKSIRKASKIISAGLKPKGKKKSDKQNSKQKKSTDHLAAVPSAQVQN